MDYYGTLGVARSATTEEIKKAFRSLAIQCHPDKCPGDKEAEEKFKRVAAAYEVLGDPSKKSEYDIKGYVGRRPSGGSPPPPPNAKPKEQAPPPPPPKPNGEPSPTDLDLVKCDFFGSGNTGRNIQTQMFLTRDEIFEGGRKYVNVKKRTLCQKCVGDGTMHVICANCKGSGKTSYGQMPCFACDERGYFDRKCSDCNGDGCYKWSILPVGFMVPPKSQFGHTITLAGEGEVAPRKSPGYLRVILLEKTG